MGLDLRRAASEGVHPDRTARGRIRRYAKGRNRIANIDRSPALIGRKGQWKNAHGMSGPDGGYAKGHASGAIHRRNPRPRNVLAPKAGLLAYGSSRWFRPSRALCKAQ